MRRHAKVLFDDLVAVIGEAVGDQVHNAEVRDRHMRVGRRRGIELAQLGVVDRLGAGMPTSMSWKELLLWNVLPDCTAHSGRTRRKPVLNVLNWLPFDRVARCTSFSGAPSGWRVCTGMV